LGLTLVILTEFPSLGAAGQELAMLIVSVITVSTLMVQIIGPSSVKFAIKRAGEIGKDLSRPILPAHRPKRRRETPMSGDMSHIKTQSDDFTDFE